MSEDKEQVVTTEIKCCLDCEHHKIISDPDPHDNFCSDDLAVICKRSPRQVDLKSIYEADHAPFKASAIACRPHNLRKEATIPPWCPLIKEGK